MLFAAKLLLVTASILLSTLAARRFGHRVSGAIGGMPMIAAPIMAILLMDHEVAQVRAIALAAIVCLPATIAHLVTFAKAAPRWPWHVCLALAVGVFLALGFGLTQLALPRAAVCVLGLLAPMVGLWYAVHHVGRPAPVAVPKAELVLRVAAAVGMAAAILLGANAFPPAFSGLLLALPVTGTILPCFTLPRYGAAATRSFTTGFLQGLHGLAAFFVVLYWALAAMNRWLAFCVALAGALAMALAVQAGVRAFRRAAVAGAHPTQ